MKEANNRRVSPKANLLGISLIIWIFTLGGCTTTRDSTTNGASIDAHIPSSWKNVPELEVSSITEGRQDLSNWWDQFNDPILSQLIHTALGSNLDLRSAVLNIERARIEKGLEAAKRLPTLTAGTSASGTRSSSLEGGGDTSSRSSSLSFSTSWELDLFGKQRDAIDSALATLGASVEDYYGMQVSLAAEVASSYISFRSLQSEYSIVRKTIRMREQTLQITEWQEAAGEVSALQVQQAIVSLEQAKSSIPSLEQEMEETLNALSLLCSKQPGSLLDLLREETQIPALPSGLTLDIPAETLSQRPDIKAQRLRIDAALASLSVAEKERLPSLELSGSIGLAEESWTDLLDPAQIVMNLSTRLTAPIWDAGRIKMNEELLNVTVRQVYLAYENLVLNALAEVENSLSNVGKTRQQINLMETATAAARQSTEIARMQYEAGDVDLLSVLDSQRSLLSLEQSLNNSKTQQLNAHIALYKTMGGGWIPSEPVL